MITALLAGIIAFAVFVLLASLTFHFAKNTRHPKVMRLALLISILFIWVSFSWFEKLGLDQLIPQHFQVATLSTFIFAFLWYIYMQLFGIIEGSITLRSLLFFYKAPNHSAGFDEFQKAQSFLEIIKTKFNLMCAMGLAKEVTIDDEKALIQTPKGRLLGGLFNFFEKFCHWKPQ
jgi:hypothetical protein